MNEAKKKKLDTTHINAHFTTKNVFIIAHVKTSLRLWTAAPMYPEQRKECLQCIVTINAWSFLAKNASRSTAAS